MKKCSVCENTDIKENADVLFINQQGEYKELCEKCSKNMETIEKNESPKEVRKAIYYFECCLDNIKDFEVKKFLNDLIDKNDNMSINCRLIEKDIQETQYGTIWIKILKYIAWFLFFGIILLGLVLSLISGHIILFIASFPITFLLVGLLMIWLDKASDIREIRNKLK